MKKFALTTIVALALVLTFTQCKKTEKPAADEGVFVTLRATYGHNEDRTDFNPGTNSFVWTEGATEIVYVGGSEHSGCFGLLYGTGTGNDKMEFTGLLTAMPNDGEYLYFFYLGKEPKTGDALTTLDFSNQDGTLASLTKNHIAISYGLAFSGMLVFDATFHPISSFAYFNTSGFGAEPVSLHGEEVYSKATVDFSNGTITGSEKGSISIGSGSNGVYVALLPSTNDETTLEFDSYFNTGSITFLRGIQKGKYYCKDNGAALNVEAVPQDFHNRTFSVSSDKKVVFSRGNLQYHAINHTWRFSEHQWDICQTTAGEWNTSGWVDLFGWGTWTEGNDPLNISNQNEDYQYNAEPTVEGQSNWRTLTGEEWSYLFTKRSGDYIFAKCNLNYGGTNSINGLIVFPDGYSALPPGITLGNINEDDSEFDHNSLTSVQWEALQDQGCVFLPAAGFRKLDEEDVVQVSYIGLSGNYWASSTTDFNGALIQDLLLFGRGAVASYYSYPTPGMSVRMVMEYGDN
jgi:hypothetical protein